MTANKRIVLNVIATYSRSLYSLALGLFTARWALMALGEIDYGLYGLVGGLAGFVAFLNSLLAVSTSRFFAYSVGQSHITGKEDAGMRECQEWFSAAFSIHFLLGIALVVVGYPLGIWAVEDYLTIPPDRITACVWVWRMTCVSCFVSMINVPFAAMYTAKQEIAEMTVYSIFTITFNAFFMYYTAHHSGDWLATYAVVACILTLIPMVVMGCRALILFDECCFVRAGFFAKRRIKEMFGYSFAQFIADFAGLVSGQGMNIVVNKMLGPAYNAAMSVGSKVTSQTLSLGSAMIGALEPAITNAAGAGQYDRMRHLAYQCCKFGAVCVLFFVVPIVLEIDYVMNLWLRTPPEGAAILCSLTVIGFVLNRLSAGLSCTVEALGRIGVFKACMGIAGFLPIVISVFLIKMGGGLASVPIAFILTTIPFGLVRLGFSVRYGGISPSHWLYKVVVPVLSAFVASLSIAYVPHLFFAPSIGRLLLTVVMSELTLMPLIWYLVLDNDDRTYFVSWIAPKVKKYLALLHD